MTNSSNRLDIEYHHCMYCTALSLTNVLKLFKELKSASEYFKILQSAAEEIELIQKFLKQEQIVVKMSFLQNPSRIMKGIDYFKRYRIDVIKESEAGTLYFEGVYSARELQTYILKNNLYEKFFYFRYFQTKHFLN